MERHVNTLEVTYCDTYFSRSIYLVLQENKEKELGLEGWVEVCYTGWMEKAFEAEE